MGDALRRLSPALRTLGFNCKAHQKLGGSIIWEISPTPHKVATQCPTSTASPEGDDEVDQVGLGHSGHEGHQNHSFDEDGTLLTLPM